MQNKTEQKQKQKNLPLRYCVSFNDLKEDKPAFKRNFFSNQRQSNKFCLLLMLLQNQQNLSLIFFFWSFCCFRPAPMANGGSQARGDSELQPLAYSTATAMLDLSCICNLYHSSQQHQILNLHAFLKKCSFPLWFIIGY